MLRVNRVLRHLTAAGRRATSSSSNAHIDGPRIITLDGVSPTIHPTAFVAPGATVIGNVVLEEHASVWFGATIRGDSDAPITIGARSNVQDHSMLHTDPGIPLTVGSDCTIGHMVMLHGCVVGDGSLVGIGSVVLNKTTIGRGCLVGAKSLLAENKNIPDLSVVMGSPGKVVKTMTEAQAATLKGGAQHYVDNAERFRRNLEE